MSPAHGSQMGGTTVTIAGKHLTGATAVLFGKQAATSYVVGSDESITALSPPGAGIVDVTVTTRFGTSADPPEDWFTYDSLTGRPSAPQRSKPIARLTSARLHGHALLLTLEGDCASCKVRLAIAAVRRAGHGTRTSDRDDRVSRGGRQQGSVLRHGVVQRRTVAFTRAKQISLKIPLDAAARSLLRAGHKLAVRVRCTDGAALVIDMVFPRFRGVNGA